MKKSLLFVLLSFTTLVLLGYFFFGSREYAPQEQPQPADSLAKAPALPQLFGIPLDSLSFTEASFKRNESLGEVLARFNISAATIAEIASLPKDLFNVRKLRAGNTYTILHTDDSLEQARYFVYHPNPIDYVVLEFGEKVAVRQGQNKVDTLQHAISGTIQSSLYNSVVEAGGPVILANELADVYAWAINFFGLQAGDCFKVVYETYKVGEEAAGFGKILTAIFQHEGKDYYAFLFDQGEGEEYFDEEGNSMRRTFLKAPLNFSRISSHFSHSRLHPILKIRRPHHGVDYAAPRGTPVLAVADGTVTQAAYSGGGGNTVKIQHNSNFITGYLHLSGFAKGIRKGVAVKQGEVIGYVGSTGLSTGPHLDFRFWKNGVPVNPLSIDPGSAEPVKEDQRTAFMTAKARQLALLDTFGESLAAMLVATNAP